MAQELVFAETAAGWFYVLERNDAPKDAWDWGEYADAFGPFQTIEEAQQHEYNSDSDTSGSEIVALGDRELSAGELNAIQNVAAYSPNTKGEHHAV